MCSAGGNGCSGGTVSAGGNDKCVKFGGQRDFNGGNLVDNGAAIGTTITSGGVQFVQTGAMASGTTVTSGSTEYVSSGASASGTTVDRRRISGHQKRWQRRVGRLSHGGGTGIRVVGWYGK